MATDRVLVEATLQGDVEAFGQLVRRYQSSLLTSAYHLLHHAEDAQDLAQEALLEAYQQLRQLRDGEKFRPWLFTILRHKCLRYLQRHPDELSLDACPEIPATPFEAGDEAIAHLFARLPLADREVLVARYLNEMPYGEIAQLLGCSVPTAYVRCKRARERLRTLLAQADEEETRRTLRRATGVLILILPGEDFVHRVLQEVNPMEMTYPRPAHHPLPTAAWHAAAGWKIAAGLVVVCALAGSRLAHRLPAQQSAVLPTMPLVQQLPAVSPPSLVEQHNSQQSHNSQVSPTPVRIGQPANTAVKPLLLANAATPAAPTAQHTPLPSAPATAATVPPKMILQIGNGTSIKWMALSPDGTRLVTTDWQNTTLLWNMHDGAIIERIPGIYSDQVAFSPDNRRLLCTGDFGTPPMAWDIDAGHAVTAPKTVSGFGHFTADGHYWEYRTPYRFHYARLSVPTTQGMPLDYLQLDSAETENVLTLPAHLQLRDLASGDIEQTVPGLTGQLLDISRDNRKAVTVTGTPRMRGITMMGIDNAELIVWDLTTGKELTRLKGLSGFIIERNAARFSPDGSKFAAASSTYGAPPDLRIWDTTTGTLLHALNTPNTTEHGEIPPPITSYLDILAFSPDGAQLASGGLDGHVAVWDVAGGQLRNMFRTEERVVDGLAFPPDGTRLLTSSGSLWRNSSIQLWEVPTGKLSRTYAGTLRPDSMLLSLQPPRAVTPDGKQLAIGAGDHIDLWDLHKGCVSRQLPLQETKYPPFSMAINPDGTLLLATLDEKSGLVFTVWDLTTGAIKKTMPAHSENYDCVTFSPDGNYAVGCNDTSLILWDTKDWSEVKRIDCTPAMLNEAAFSPDGMKLAWLSTNYTKAAMGSQLVVWDIPSDRRDTISSKNFFDGLAFSPDGKWLATHSSGQVIRWNVTEGKEEKPVKLPDELRLKGQISFTADSTHLLCTVQQQHLVCCNIDTGEVKPIDLGELSPFLGISLVCQGRELITWDVDGTASLWDSAEVLAQRTAQPRATLHTFEKNLWLIATPAGYFDCAPGVTKAIRWQQGKQNYPCAQFEKEYHRPEMVRKALNEE